MQNECGDPYRRAELLLDLAAQVKKINERLQIARRSVPDPDERSSQRAGFALLHLDKTSNDDPAMWQSDEEDALPRVPRHFRSTQSVGPTRRIRLEGADPLKVLGRAGFLPSPAGANGI